jgi:peptide/nickel transport system ATP-binding protein
MKQPILTIENLSVAFKTRNGLAHGVKNVSFTLGRDKLGIVGESGSGKSATARAIIRLLPHNSVVAATKIDFQGIDLLNASPKQMRAIRGKKIAMVMQDPKFSLNPVIQIGEQVAESFRAHGETSKKEARNRAFDMLKAVKIRRVEQVYHAYPHEVSGGMGQRIMLAMMLAPEPDILIADEMTSALDVTVQSQVLAILDDLVTAKGMGLIFISHDLTLVSSFCDHLVVMYMGKVMETCLASDLTQAKHPYTRGLMNCLPNLKEKRAELPVLQRDPAWLV